MALELLCIVLHRDETAQSYTSEWFTTATSAADAVQMREACAGQLHCGSQ